MFNEARPTKSAFLLLHPFGAKNDPDYTLQKAATSRDLYLPPGSRWYDVSRLLTEGVWSESEVGVVTMATPLDLLPLHVRGGQVRDSDGGSLNYHLPL